MSVRGSFAVIQREKAAQCARKAPLLGDAARAREASGRLAPSNRQNSAANQAEPAGTAKRRWSCGTARSPAHSSGPPSWNDDAPRPRRTGSSRRQPVPSRQWLESSFSSCSPSCALGARQRAPRNSAAPDIAMVEKIITVEAITKRRANFLVRGRFRLNIKHSVRPSCTRLPATGPVRSEEAFVTSEADEETVASPSVDLVSRLGADEVDAQGHGYAR